ncbi:hypothetical protein [Thermosynechococcus sp.]
MGWHWNAERNCGDTQKALHDLQKWQMSPHASLHEGLCLTFGLLGYGG